MTLNSSPGLPSPLSLPEYWKPEYFVIAQVSSSSSYRTWLQMVKARRTTKMSRPTSISEKIQDTASSAYESAANTISATVANQNYDPDLDNANFKKDAHGNIAKKGDFKDKLDEAAHGRPVKEENYIEKGAWKANTADFPE